MKEEQLNIRNKIKVERIQKSLANAGLGSRREIEKWIQEGKVKVDGAVAEIGQLVSTRNRIHVSGKLVSLEEKLPDATRVILYHKPEGEICSQAKVEVKKTVFAGLPPLKQGKWIMVGRLDVNTSGLLLFTNNGELANRLMHPRFQIEREYAVRVLGRVTENTLARLKQGVKLEEGLAHFRRIIPHEKTESSNQWFSVVLSEGRYREVRRLWESQGCIVSRLIRIRYGTIHLPRHLRKGSWEEVPLHAIEAMTGALSPCVV